MKTATLLLFVKKVEYAYAKFSEPLLEEFNLPQVSFDILMFLANNPEYKTAKEICENRHIKKNLVSVHVEKLVSAGYLARGPIEGDRRKIGLTCTLKSKHIIDAGFKMQENFIKNLTNGITEDDWKKYKSVIDTIEANARAMVDSDEERKCVQ